MPKCRWCGKQIDKNNAFCSPTGGGRFYYCSEDEFNAQVEARRVKLEKEQTKKQREIDPVYEEIADILGYRSQNSILFKEMKLWRGICDDQKILAYLQEHKDYIKNAVGRLNNNEYARIRYVSAILKNSLSDFKPNVVTVEKPKVIVDETIYDTPSHTLNKRRSLEDLEDVF